MKTERKFTWCVRYYDVMSGTVSYRVFIGLTVREINDEDMSDKVYNFFNCCEHPRIIKNKYTGEPVYVKCGVCPHCLISRSDAKRNLCDYEKSNRKYCYFVTLTYNSQYVPKMALLIRITVLPKNRHRRSTRLNTQGCNKPN
jgi:hypothetical protein